MDSVQEFLNTMFQGIATVGFPAACCVYLLKQNAKQDEARNSELERFRKVIEENTSTLKELVLYLKK